MSFRPYAMVAITEFKDQLAQPAALIGRLFFLALILWVFVNMWTTIYAGRTVVEGFTLSQLMWYIAFSEVLVFSMNTLFIETIGEDVRTGALVTSLTKPTSYPLVVAARLFGSGVLNFFAFGSVSAIVTLLLVGRPDFGLSHLPFVFVGVIAGLLLNLFIVLSLGFSAFWFEDVSAMYWIYHKATFVLGGMLAPIEMYPTWIKEILSYLPFVYTTYGPTKLLVKFSVKTFETIFLGQLLWILIAIVVLVIIYNRGIKKVHSNGG